MKDVQAEEDRRGKTIHKVGVRKLQTLVQYCETQMWAEISSYITLDSFKRGAHMSRFVEVMNKTPQRIDKPISYLKGYMNDLLNAHKVEEVFLKVRTAIPFDVLSPRTRNFSTRKIPLELEGEIVKGTPKYFIRTKIYVTSLCPCSKEISDQGAHNQRAIIDVRMQVTKNLEIADIIHRLRTLGSAPIYPILKRSDERYVTERAYANPKFCEDIARDVSLELDKIEGISNYSVVIESEESIHDHNALAIIDYFKFD